MRPAAPVISTRRGSGGRVVTAATLRCAPGAARRTRAVPLRIRPIPSRSMTNPNVEPGQRRDLWLALLRRLTDVSSSFLVWKNVESALEGQGDIDAAAAPADWDALEQQFVAWARELELLPAALCHHIPGGRNLIAAPVGTPTFFELSIKHDKAFRGSTLFVL